MQVPAEISEQEVKKQALNQERIKQLLTGKEVKKVVWVPKKLINIVA